MGTPAFEKLSKNERERIITELYEYQKGLCYICEDEDNKIDLSQPVDVDHIRSRDRGGIDKPE